MTDEALERQRQILVMLEDLFEQKEIFWLQRGRANWLRHGDRNTNFFHHFATTRKKRNLIKMLLDDNGNIVEGDSLAILINDYFSGLFTSEVNAANEEVLDKVKPRVTPAMNDHLLAPFTSEEVRKALFDIGDLKAPGPDGLHAAFYKRFWVMLEEDLVKEVLEAVNTVVIPEGWNDTVIVLIPKVDKPEKLSRFQPISLCNVVYKVISKMLAKRLKGILPEVIGEAQSAFVPGRLITDNVLVAYESVHRIKRKKGNHGLCAVKLDMHKAYDRVEWCFLEGIMLRMGFDVRWVELMMACVKSVTYSVKFNSQITERFIPSRGLRQGDPLSPYLFLLVAEGLSALLSDAEERGAIEGVKVCRDAPSVSHLLFADDSLILMKADVANANTLKGILQSYCNASGQMVSEAKCSIYFSPNTSVDKRVEVCTTLNILVEALSEKYLGLPLLVGADRSDKFQYLVDRVCQLVQGWKEKTLSIGGKEVLLKVVAQALPAYAMSVFRIPKNICKGITDAIAQCWWGNDISNKKMHWFAWWKLCVPKEIEGMGFRDPHCFNLAMLGKQIWRLTEAPDSLCARVLRSKYYPDGKILKAKLKSGSSFTWQSILSGLNTFNKGAIWRVGDGQQIDIWEDAWLPYSNNGRILTPKGHYLLKHVHELIDPSSGVWDADLIRSIFWDIDANKS